MSIAAVVVHKSFLTEFSSSAPAWLASQPAQGIPQKAWDARGQGLPRARLFQLHLGTAAQATYNLRLEQALHNKLDQKPAHCVMPSVAPPVPTILQAVLISPAAMARYRTGCAA